MTFGYTHQEREDYWRLELACPNWAHSSPQSKLINHRCGIGREALSLRNVTGRGSVRHRSEFVASEQRAEVPAQAVRSHGHRVAIRAPYEKKFFDIVYSHGVLHHTYSTKDAMEAVYRHKNDAGMIYIWLYAQEDFAKNLILIRSHVFETICREKNLCLPSFLQNIVVHLFAWEYHWRQKRIGYNRDKWKYKNSLHMMRDRWTCRYAHRHSFHEVMCWFLEKGLDYQLVNSLAYHKRFGFPLIGIGIRAANTQAPAIELRRAA